MRRKYLTAAAVTAFVLLFTQILPADSLKNSLRELNFQIIEDDINFFDFTLKDLNGKDVKLSDYRGKIIMLNFWATWCPPCREEMPSMEGLYSKLRGKNFEMIAVNIQEKEATVKNYIRNNNYTFPVLLDVNAEAASKYQIMSIPTTYIIDTRGKLAAGFIGARDWSSPNLVKVFSELAK